MVQGGDPTGTGKGGSCVYDTPKFADEIVPSLKHDKAGIVSMANSGPNTNGTLPPMTLLGGWGKFKSCPNIH